MWPNRRRANGGASCVRALESTGVRSIRRRIIVENVATLVDPPTVDEMEANPFSIEEAKAFLKAAAERPTFMRWVVGVGMDFRQGQLRTDDRRAARARRRRIR